MVFDFFSFFKDLVISTPIQNALLCIYNTVAPVSCSPDQSRSVVYFRPYHGVLLLVDGQNLLDSLSTDCTPALNRLINVIIQLPVRSLQIIALEADLSLSQVHLFFRCNNRGCPQSVIGTSPYSDVTLKAVLSMSLVHLLIQSVALKATFYRRYTSLFRFNIRGLLQSGLSKTYNSTRAKFWVLI